MNKHTHTYSDCNMAVLLKDCKWCTGWHQLCQDRNNWLLYASYTSYCKRARRAYFKATALNPNELVPRPSTKECTWKWNTSSCVTEPVYSASFMPVSRIISRCAVRVTTMQLNYGEGKVCVVIPIRRHFLFNCFKIVLSPCFDIQFSFMYSIYIALPHFKSLFLFLKTFWKCWSIHKIILLGIYAQILFGNCTEFYVRAVRITYILYPDSFSHNIHYNFSSKCVYIQKHVFAYTSA